VAAADLGEQTGDLIDAASALHGLARLGHARDVTVRLSSLASGIDGELVAARAAYASAVAAQDSEALKGVCGDFEDMGAILYAAEASAEVAVVLRRAGNARAAAAAEQKSSASAGPLRRGGHPAGPGRRRPGAAHAR
jgi:hypothetical protein